MKIFRILLTREHLDHGPGARRVGAQELFRLLDIAFVKMDVRPPFQVHFGKVFEIGSIDDCATARLEYPEPVFERSAHPTPGYVLDA